MLVQQFRFQTYLLLYPWHDFDHELRPYELGCENPGASEYELLLQMVNVLVLYRNKVVLQ